MEVDEKKLVTSKEEFLALYYKCKKNKQMQKEKADKMLDEHAGQVKYNIWNRRRMRMKNK